MSWIGHANLFFTAKLWKYSQVKSEGYPLKKYVFLFSDENKRVFICEQCVEACGMHDAFTQIQKIANNLVRENHCPLKIELKGVQYLDAV